MNKTIYCKFLHLFKKRKSYHRFSSLFKIFDFLTKKESADVVVLAEMIKKYDSEKQKGTVIEIDSMII